MRIGIGFDIHKLTENRKLILGGIEIPHEKGLLGHSDADVLCHAIMDALLGALSLGDIGELFPDSDEKYKDADSVKLLQEVIQLIHSKGYSVLNIDTIIMAEKPKIKPFADKIQSNLAQAISLKKSQISIKATTTEKLGFVGREEGIAAQAAVLLEANS